MSDEIFEVTTSFTDVAELGQGFIDRVDGERILLALPTEVSDGEGVRFIVYLVDGTPAFAGAGRCVQVSDQGEQAAEARFETLLDSLAFDERSAPVYEYIVAVRQLAYNENTATGSDGGPDEAVYENEELTATRELDEAGAVGTGSDDLDANTRETKESLAPVEAAAAVPRSDPPPPATISVPPVMPSVVPEPLPTGILTRPAIAAHWAPAVPRAPQRSMRPTRFQYPVGPLPIPTEPPRPQLDRNQWVERAEAPAR